LRWNFSLAMELSVQILLLSVDPDHANFFCTSADTFAGSSE
jgi:hypothetical protein